MFRCFIGGEGRCTANQNGISDLDVRQFHQHFALSLDNFASLLLVNCVP